MAGYDGKIEPRGVYLAISSSAEPVDVHGIMKFLGLDDRLLCKPSYKRMKGVLHELRACGWIVTIDEGEGLWRSTAAGAAAANTSMLLALASAKADNG